MADCRADHAFFVFGDLNIKLVGQFRLKFTLFEMHKRYVQLPNTKMLSNQDQGQWRLSRGTTRLHPYKCFQRFATTRASLTSS